MATAALIAGGVLLAFGQIKAGQTAQAQGEFNKKIATRNANALKRQAKAEREAASIEESRISRKEKRVAAANRAAIGKSGIGAAGATLSALSDVVAQFSIDRNLTLRRGLIRSRELLGQAGITLARGRFAATLGRAAKRASFISATGSVLTAIGAAGAFSGGTGAGTVGSGGGLPNLGGARFPGVVVT